MKLDHDAATEAFAEFINSQALNEQQISFVRKVVDYVVENGYDGARCVNAAALRSPQSFVRMFTTEQQMSLVAIISRIKSNAEILRRSFSFELEAPFS